MADIFQEGAKQLRAQQAYQVLEKEIINLARSQIRALNGQIPELYRRLNAWSLPPDFDGRGWCLVNHTVPSGSWAESNYRYGIAQLHDGHVHEYEITRGQTRITEIDYDIRRDLPPSFLGSDVLNRALMPTTTTVLDVPSPFPIYHELGGVATYGFKFDALLRQIEASLGVTRTTAIDCSKVSQYACRIDAWTEAYERSLIALAARVSS